MAEDSDDCKGHSSEITERISDESPSRIPIVLDECEHDSQERHHQAQREQMAIFELFGSVGEAECEPMGQPELGEVEMDVEQIVADDRQTDDDRLAHFDPVDPR